MKELKKLMLEGLFWLIGILAITLFFYFELNSTSNVELIKILFFLFGVFYTLTLLILSFEISVFIKYIKERKLAKEKEV